ncbi:MAG: inorganic phosphate transporter [Candidatus Anaerobiospirillum merdipullorum]|uniref:Phosphate transporter n=1 Tax=Candidatus Anaerobiospirillum merdipullorum TaxID=2838450 RepID=A0A9E2KNG2_9GAMM|nr:inorganic phosphate transporter [Candidatus Anaerobiospirillum merdipullorum]
MFDQMFIVLVGFLLVLAAIDLFVGVSNDAVNFLNSAVGSRISSLQVIMLVASAGVLLGATFSSGMMEVARSGVFHPDMFTFYEVIIIFFGVMITDVLLLNVFNSLGLPTSTTVSIVFELLGAAVCAAVFKLYGSGHSYYEIFEYVKSDRAITIVSAILVSVAVAFIAGMVVQFVCRILFTFRIEHSVKYLGGIFTGFSLTAIIYFLIMKGAKGASFMKPEYIAFIQEHTTTLLWTFFIGLSVMAQILVFLKFNVFKIIILGGTFALAFSFAGNDLVNFIGVPLAALDSFNIWVASGLPADGIKMDALNDNSAASSLYLIIAGLIMVVTLWTSKKAHRVIQTSINLSSSSRGEHEQFGASTPGRLVTRFGLGISRAVYHTMPKVLLAFFAMRYRKVPLKKGEVPLPFDYVRASINLVIASILIASATSLKLPLSTTYVTFMVAMGTSFADGAWDRESAVFRISGVITVIAGWFLTGLSAFTACFVVTLLFFGFGAPAMFILMAVSVVVIIRTNFSKAKTTETVASVIEARGDNSKILAAVSAAVPNFLEQNTVCLERALNAFFDDNEFKLRKARNKASNVLDAISKERSEYYNLALEKNSDIEAAGTVDAKHFFYLAFSNMREASKSMRYCIDKAVEHVANRHTIFNGQMKESLFDLLSRLQQLMQDMHHVAVNPDSASVEAFIKHGKKINRSIDKYQMALVDTIGSSHVSMHSSEMYLSFLQAIRDCTNRYVAVAMLERALSQLVHGNKVDKAVEQAQMQSQVVPAAISTASEDTLQRATQDEGPVADNK